VSPWLQWAGLIDPTHQLFSESHHIYRIDSMNLLFQRTAPFLLVVATSLASNVWAQAKDAQYFDPAGLAQEHAFFSQRRTDLLNHVWNAKNLILSKRYDDIAPWKIDWPRQKAFYKKVAQVVFKEQNRRTFPEPQFFTYRDPAEKLAGVWSVAYPSCKRISSAEGCYVFNSFLCNKYEVCRSFLSVSENDSAWRLIV
jgi:hypothetical protein